MLRNTWLWCLLLVRGDATWTKAERDHQTEGAPGLAAEKANPPGASQGPCLEELPDDQCSLQDGPGGEKHVINKTFVDELLMDGWRDVEIAPGELLVLRLCCGGESLMLAKTPHALRKHKTPHAPRKRKDKKPKKRNWKKTTSKSIIDLLAKDSQRGMQGRERVPYAKPVRRVLTDRLQ